jgi:L-asparagine transporter-like permease
MIFRRLRTYTTLLTTEENPSLMQQLQNELTSCNAIMVVLLLLLLLFLFQTLLPPKLRAKLISNLALQELVPHTKKDDVEVKR